MSTSSQQLAITTHLPHNYCTPQQDLETFQECVGLYHKCLNVSDDGNHLRELRNSVSHSAFLESLNSETMHFRTYVDINYFDCLHVRNSFLNLCRVFFKHPVCVCVCVCMYVYIYIYIYTHTHTHTLTLHT
jgi:hypothetical protein